MKTSFPKNEWYGAFLANVLFALLVSLPVSGAQWPNPDTTTPFYRDSANSNPFAYSYAGQCTWFVYGRVQETLPITHSDLDSRRNRNGGNGIFLGHAYTWDNDASGHFTVGPTPRAGAIAVWDSGTANHVAFVEEAISGQIRVTESNIGPIARDGTYRDIITTIAGVRLRAAPGASQQLLWEMPRFTVMRVVGGPRSADGYRWYSLTGNGHSGWAARISLAQNTWNYTGIQLTPAAPFLPTNPDHYIYLDEGVLPAIYVVAPATLPTLPLPQRQRITITGSEFTSASRFTFFDGTSTYADRVPVFVSPTELKYDIAVGDRPGTWTVRVVNGIRESAAFPFFVSPGSDVAAPAAPFGVTTGTGNWWGNNPVLIDWTNPSDPSGVVKLWCKIGPSPTSPTDGMSFPLPFFKPLPLLLPILEGVQNVHLWLEDGAGNRDHNNRATTTVRLDATQPRITVSGQTRTGQFAPSQDSMTSQKSFAASEASAFSGTPATVTLSGDFGDDLSGVTRVSWVNYSGGSGEATISGPSASGSWSTPPIALASGENLIEVTAFDDAGNEETTFVVATNLNTSNSGSVSITLSPQDAINAGAQWRVNGGAWHNSGDTESGVPVGPRYVMFMSIPGGWRTPAGFNVGVVAGQTSTGTGIYTPVVVNQSPSVPSDPTPAHGAVNIPRQQPIFTWSGSDPDGPVEFIVCLDPANPGNPDPPFYWTWGSAKSFQYPATLLAGTTYNWRVKARDDWTTIDGPVWSFTTAYAYADLVARNLTLTGNVEPGAQVTLSVTVTNAGNFTAPGSHVHFYLSRSPGAKELRLTPNVPESVPNLEPGQAQTVTFTATLNNLQAGKSYIDAWIDSGPPGPFNENNFGNNLQSIPINYIDGKSPEVTYAAIANYFSFVKTGQGRSIIYFAKDDVGISTLDFYYSLDSSGTWYVIQEGYAPPYPPTYGATLPWTIPTNLPLTTNLHIRVVARDPSGNYGERIAGPYTVRDGTQPTITVLTPNGGEVWDMATTHEIRWDLSSQNGVRELYISFLANGTTFWSVYLSTNSGVYAWTLPNNFSTTIGRIRIRVTDMNGNEAEDTSDGFFTIRDSSVPPPPPWTSPEAITTLPLGDEGNHDTPRIATDTEGNLHLIYTYYRQAGARDQAILYQKKTGATWSPPLTLYTNHLVLGIGEFSRSISGIRIATDIQNRPLVVWKTSYGHVSEWNKADILYSKYDGSSWSSPENLSDGIRGPFFVNTMSWAASAELPTAQYSAACAAANGSLYVMGGGGSCLLTYEYNPGGNVWTRKADIPGEGISEGGAATVNGKIYAIGDQSTGRVKIYNPATDTWSEGAAIPTRRRFPCVVAIDDLIYAIGGWDPYSGKNEVYNPATDSWTTKADMPTPRGLAVAGVVGNRIYVIGGRIDNGGAATDRIEMYDPWTDAWSLIPKPDSANWRYADGATAAVLNDKIYIMGGLGSKAVWEFDPTRTNHMVMQSMTTNRYTACSATLGSQIYVVGGRTGQEYEITLSSVEAATVTATLTGTESGPPDIAVDASNVVHVVWSDGRYWQPDAGSPFGFSAVGTNDVHHRSKAPSQSWSQVTRLTTGWGGSPALASDPLGNVHLVYEYPEQNIGYMKWNQTSWSASVLAATPSHGQVNVAADAGGHPHVAWYYYNSQVGRSQVYYSFFDGATWSAPEPLSVNTYAYCPSVLAGVGNRPHVVWEAWDYPYRLYYRTKSSSAWLNSFQLNLSSQPVVQYSSDAALSLVNNEMHVVWASSKIFYNHAYVGETNDVYAPSVSATAPDSGRMLSVGSPYVIHWNAVDNTAVTTVDLAFTTDGGTNWVLIATNEPNDGSYDWTVPSTGTNVAMVRVVAWDAAGNSGAGFSGTFTTADLTPPVVVVTSPTNGTILVGNTTTDVTWSATDNAGVTRIDLEYSLNNGASWFEMAAGLSNTGAYAWMVPNLETETLLVRATARDDAGYAASATSQPARIVRANNTPVPPHSPFPLDGGSNVPPTAVALQWSSGDVDGDALTYQVLLGTNANPPVAATTTETQFMPGFLLPGTAYHWQVMASDGKATNAGPVWTFTTAYGTMPLAVLSGIEVLTNGCLHLHLEGVFGQAYTLQASTNLLDWADLMTVRITNGTALLLDTTATNYQWQFYRAMEQ